MSLLLKILNLKKSYTSSKKKVFWALRDISFDIRSGEILSLLGVNGAGKTTLSSILVTLYRPTSGDILWQDKSIYNDLLSYRRVVGFCPQKQNLDGSLTLEQNLIFAGRYYGLSRLETEQNKNTLIEQFGLKDYAKSKAAVLSGGFRQRFLIARSLMHSPKFLILDEPTVGLDPQVRRQLWKYIRALRDDGITVLLTTHYLDEAEALSDRVCLIDSGKVKIVDTPDNLKAGCRKNNLEDVFLHLIEGVEK